jgi:hypothetical protein
MKLILFMTVFFASNTCFAYLTCTQKDLPSGHGGFCPTVCCSNNDGPSSFYGCKNGGSSVSQQNCRDNPNCSGLNLSSNGIPTIIGQSKVDSKIINKKK